MKSTDRGRTWEKAEHNPVLRHIVGGNRDPKVFWYEPDHKWVMALYLDKNDFALFESKELQHWRRLSNVTIPGTSECPEFFEIAVDGKRKDTRWVFYGGDGRYLIGYFDGTNFTQKSGPHALNFGNCFYASQTYNQLPTRGRRVMVGWGQINFPGMPFNQMMNFPVELTLRTTELGLRLFAEPVRELDSLYGKSYRLKTMPLTSKLDLFPGVNAELFDLNIEFSPNDAKEVGLEVRGVTVTYDVEKKELSCLGKKAALPLEQGRMRLRLLVDRGSLEIFGNSGRVYMPMGIILKDEQRAISAEARGGKGNARIEFARLHELSSAWR